MPPQVPGVDAGRDEARWPQTELRPAPAPVRQQRSRVAAGKNQGEDRDGTPALTFDWTKFSEKEVWLHLVLRVTSVLEGKNILFKVLKLQKWIFQHFHTFNRFISCFLSAVKHSVILSRSQSPAGLSASSSRLLVCIPLWRSNMSGYRLILLVGGGAFSEVSLKA